MKVLAMILRVLTVLALSFWAYSVNKETILTIKLGWVDVLVYGFFALTVLAGMMMALYILGKKALFIYAKREGFVSLLYYGIENGEFDRAIGAMRGHTIHPGGEITEDSDSTSSAGLGFTWIGLWPLHGAMTFDTEQVKLVNEPNGSVGMKVTPYSDVIYLPIQSTERLLVPGLELADLASKIDWDVVITFKMTNAYIAKIKNRGSIKILKAHVMQGLRETAGDMDYAEALKLKNARGPAYLMGLTKELNSKDCGFGTLSEATGYTLISIDIIGIELSGGGAEAIAAAYASTKTTAIAADNLVVTARAEREKRILEGQGTAEAASLMVNQVLRRLVAQRDLTPEQAMALAIEIAKPQVIGGNSLINLDQAGSKKPEPK